MNTKNVLELILGIALSVSFTNPAFAQLTFDPSTGFSASVNPIGAWSYGWSSVPGADFTIYQFSGTVSGLKQWSRSQDASHRPTPPTVDFNPASHVIIVDQTLWQPNRITFHPGPSGEHSVVRWTAPRSGTVSLLVSFEGRDSVIGATSDAHVLYNSTILFSAPVAGFADKSRTSFSTNLTVATGDRIDFTVGYGDNGNYTRDTTELDVTISMAGTVQPVAAKVARAVEISWDSDPGVLYQVQWTSDVDAGAWTNTGPSLIGNGATQSYFERGEGLPKRFYRVIGLP